MSRLWSALVVIASVFIASEARAQGAQEDSPLETADGVAGCRAFQDRNELGLHRWEKEQPPTPYVYPRPDTFLNAPFWAGLFKGVADSPSLVLATLIPHVGAQFRGDAPAALVSWPLTIAAIGPMYACSRKPGTYVVDGHRVHRFMLEPGLDSGKQSTGVFVRPGYRFIWHPTSWVVGPGLGLGSTVEIAGNKEPFRYSIGPEAVAHFGNCCASSYFTLAFRYDHFFKGTNREIIGGSLGYTFF